MIKYRFKTEEEFKRDFLWNKDRPVKWVKAMNKYLGKDIPDKYNQACDKQEGFRYEPWHIEPHDYVLKETAFVLPSKWRVKVDRNCQPEEVHKWRNIIWNDAGYICHDKHWNQRVFSSHTEITLEQFKQHVLKESPVVETKKEMFHEGDYIVTLDVEVGYNCARKNYCFKQRVNNKGIYPAIDLQGSIDNGHNIMSFDKTKYLKDWRYATLEEAAEYERIGKPYDVTTLQKKEESIPEYVECIKSITNSFTVGKIYDWPYPIDDQKDRRAIPMQGSLYTFKPSTKEAYEAQNVPKKTVIEEWSEGTYAVGIKGGFGLYSESEKPVGLGKIYTIEQNRGTTIAVKESSFWVSRENLRWFATYLEALDFSKELKASPVPKESDYPVIPKDAYPSIKKETFIDNVQSVDVILRTKRKSIKF